MMHKTKNPKANEYLRGQLDQLVVQNANVTPGRMREKKGGGA